LVISIKTHVSCFQEGGKRKEVLYDMQSAIGVNFKHTPLKRRLRQAQHIAFQNEKDLPGGGRPAFSRHPVAVPAGSHPVSSRALIKEVFVFK
jgi:hypothetical protein